jgi:capsular exopolysaccharide synthesis family protein
MSNTAFSQGSFGPASSTSASPVLSLIRTVRRQAPLAALAALCVAGAGIAVTLSLQPRYTAQAEVYVTPDTPDPLATEPGTRALADDMVATVAELLHGRDLVAEVVQKLGIGLQPAPQGALHKALCTVLPSLHRCQPLAPPTLDARVGQFLAALTVSAGEHVRVIQLAYMNRDPALAAKALNGLVSAYQDEQIATRIQDLQRTAGWISHRADSLRERWLGLEAKLGAYRAAHDIGAASSTTPALIDQQIAHAALGLSEAQSAQAIAQARANAMESGGVAAEAGTDPGLAALSSQVSQAEAADGALRAQFGPNHPRVQAADRELAAARAGLGRETGRIRLSVLSDLAAKSATVSALTANLQNLRQQAARLNGTEVDLTTLTNEAEEARSAYELFQARAKQMADRTQLLQPEIRFASHAVAPAAPSFPKTARFIAGSLVLGLLAGLCAALAREHFRRGFTNVSRVGEQLNVPLLSIVPRVAGAQDGLARYIRHHPFSDAAESMRALAARLQVGTGEAPKTLVIASATGQEGKTTLALWLAMSLAAAGQKILLIDGDHRRGMIGRQLGQDARSAGFADLLTGQAGPDEVIRRAPEDGFDYVSAGFPTARAFGRPELRRLSAALRTYRDRYDLVLIDTPPLLAMTEALLCANTADSTVFLCRWDSTRREAAMHCLERLEEAGASIAGVVLSMVETKRLALFSDEHQSADIKLIEGYYHAA